MRPRSSSLRPLLSSVRNRRSDLLDDITTRRSVPPQDLRTGVNSIACLDQQLATDPDPLLRWACETDLTAENIVFLRSVSDFKKKWPTTEKRLDLEENGLREQFEDAAVIWFKLINPTTAKFNINIDHRTFLEMEQVFKGLRYEPFREEDSLKSLHSENVIAPWIDEDRPTSCLFDECEITELDRLYIHPATDTQTSEFSFTSTEVSSSHVPESFSTDVFDQAYDIVRSDVFHNTWHRYESQWHAPETKSIESGPVDARSQKRQGYVMCLPVQRCQRAVQAFARRLCHLRPKKFV